MKLLFLPILLALFLAVPVITHTAHAATTFSIESVGADIGLGGADLKQTTINIIQWVLGLLALLAVVMIIYSVISAATASDGDRAEKAKRGIAGAVIGLIIVLLAWAIVIFVTRTASNITTNS